MSFGDLMEMCQRLHDKRMASYGEIEKAEAIRDNLNKELNKAAMDCTYIRHRMESEKKAYEALLRLFFAELDVRDNSDHMDLTTERLASYADTAIQGILSTFQCQIKNMQFR